MLQNRIYLGEIAHKGQTYPGAHTGIVDQALWNQAKTLLAQSRVESETRRYAKEPSLLAGLLFDINGYRLTPIHATKQAKRYRYYEGRPPVDGQTKNAKSVRIPAHDLEHVVVNAALQSLRSDAEITRVLRPLRLPVQVIRRFTCEAGKLASGWDHQSVVERIALLKQIVHRIVVDGHDVSIEVSHQGLVKALIARNKEIEPIERLQQLQGRTHISVRTEIKRCRGEVRLIAPEDDPNDRLPQLDPALIKATARAHIWREHLFSGRATTISDIAQMAGVSPRYVRTILNLTYLSPRLVEAILAGRQPIDLTLDQLCAGLPSDWRAQEQRFGLTARQNPPPTRGTTETEAEKMAPRWR